MTDGGTNVGSIVGDLSIKVGEALSRIDQVISRLDKLEAVNTRTSRKTVSETDKAKAAYNKLAASLDPVIAKNQRYEKSQDTLNRALKLGVITQDQYNRTLSQAKERLETTTHWTQRLGSEIGSGLKSQVTSLINPTTLALAGITALAAGTVKLVKDIVTASTEAEISANKVATAVERYGQRAGITVADIDRLAAAQSRLTGIDDELIADNIALGLRFNRLSGDEIPRLIRVAQDMSQVLGIDLSAAIEKSGNLVNLPQQALTRLRREGYAVSEGQEKLIKDLLRAGDVAGAQAEVFKLLESQYGGAAETARDTLGGAFTALGTTWENFLEKVGEDRLGPLREGVETLIDLIEEATDHVDDLTIAFHYARLRVNEFTADALRGLAGIFELASKVGPVFGLVGIGLKKLNDLTDAAARARAGAAAADRNARESNIALLQALAGVHGEQARGKTTTDELTDSEIRLAEQIAKLREQAEAAVLASRDELANVEALLQARKRGTEALKLQQNVQAALAKAQAAGTGATAEQRLEIIRNTLAIFRAKDAIDEIGEAQKRAAGLFAESNKEMLRQVTILSDLEQVAIDLSKAAIEINIDQVSSGGSIATEITRARLDYANEWRDAWKSASEVATEEIQRIADSLLTIEEKERAIAQLRSDLLSHHLSEWGGFLDELGSLIGGKFGQILSQISAAFDRIGQAASTGNQIGSTLQTLGVGGATGLLGSLGYFFAVVQIFYEIYKAVDAQIQKNRARKWGNVSQLEIVAGDWSSPSFFGRSGREVDKGIRDLLRSIEQSVGGFLENLPQITIRARKDQKEFSAYVAGLWIGTFSDAQSAIGAAIAYAVSNADFSGISELIASALQNSIDVTLEELQSNIEFSRRLELQNLPESVQSLMSSLWQFHSDFTRAMELFRLDFSARGTAIGSIIENFLASVSNSVNSLWQTYNRIRGIEEDPIVQLERDRQAFNLNRSLTQAQIVLMFAEIDARIADLRATDTHAHGIIRHGEVILGVTEAIAKASQSTEDLIRQLEDARNALAGIVLPDPIEPGDVKPPKPARGSRGGRIDTREGVLDFLRSREIALMGDLSGQIASLTDEYKEEIKTAGKNKDLIAELTEMRRREIESLRDQTRAELITPYVGGINAGSRSDFDRQRLDINRAYDDYRNNARALGEAIWRINAAEKERLRILGLEASAAAGSRTASTVLELQNLGQTISFLRDHAEELGVSFSALMEELQGERFVVFGDRLLSFLDKYYGDTAGFEQFRINLERTRFALELANMHLQFTLLRNLGALTDKTISQVEGIFDFINNNPIDWDKFIKGDDRKGDNGNDNGFRFKGYGSASTSFTNTVNDVEENLNRLAESFKQAKESINDTLNDISRGDLGIVSPEDAFRAAQEQYNNVIASAKRGELSGFEQTPEATRNYIEALKRFSPALAVTELPNIKGTLSLLANATTVRDNNLIYTEKFAQNQERGNKILTDGFADLSNSLHTQNGLQSQVLGRLSSIASSQSDLNARLARIESGQVAQKR